MSEEYLIQCWYCLGEFDAGAAVWCSCDPKDPTKLCPYCMQCFCRATEEYKSRIFEYAPVSLRDERESLRKIKDRLGELLVRAKVLTIKDLLTALNHQRSNNKLLGQLLIEEKFLTNEELEIFLQIQSLELPPELTEQTVDMDVLARLNPEFCLQRKIVPLKTFSGESRSFLVLGMTNPRENASIEIVSRKTGMFVVPFYIGESSIKSFLQEHVPPGSIRILQQETLDVQATIRKIIIGAIKRHASDIYIEPDPSEISIRYRIDGVLYKVKAPPNLEQAPLMSNVKKVAKMDLTKSGAPQSSKMVLKHGQKKFQLNFFTFPNRFGESVSIKIVDLSTFLRDLAQIGLDDSEYQRVVTCLEATSGLVLIGGPLMNGCNTTLYAMMRYFSDSQRQVMTLESPIFAAIPNIQQSEVNPGAGLDFVSGLNSLISSDADVIFLTDIPNAEVAATLCKVATRRLVVSTVSAISAAESIVMLRELGSSASLLSQVLSMVIAQRLIRRICVYCCEKSAVSPSLLMRMGLAESEAANTNAYMGLGCSECNYLGFNGRAAIFEVLFSGPHLRDTIAAGATAREIEETAVAAGMISLRQRCLQKVNEGITTLEEFEKGKF